MDLLVFMKKIIHNSKPKCVDFSFCIGIYFCREISYCLLTLISHTFDFEDWKFKSFKIGGTFRLSNHDEKFDDYLKSLDIPQFAIEMIKSAKEIIQVVEPTQTNPNWTLKMSTGVNLHSILNKRLKV